MSQEKRLQKYDEGIRKMQQDVEKSREKVSDEQMEAVTQAFLYYYLLPERFTMEECLEYTREWAAECRPDLIPIYEDIKARLLERFP